MSILFLRTDNNCHGQTRNKYRDVFKHKGFGREKKDNIQ